MNSATPALVTVTFSLPEAALVPLQSPDAVRESACSDVQVRVTVPPTRADVGLTLSETTGSSTAAVVNDFQSLVTSLPLLPGDSTTR